MHFQTEAVARRFMLAAAAVAAVLVLVVAPVAHAQIPPDLSQATTTQQIFDGKANDPYTLAVRAYVWGFPLELAAQIRIASTNPSDPFAPRPATSGANALNKMGFQKELSDPRFTVGPGVNNDTLYALAHIDTDSGPFVLETPDFGTRYYTFQMAQTDKSTDLSLGRAQRTNGSKTPTLFIYGPHCKGKVPKGILGVLSHQRYFGIFGRILVDPSKPGPLRGSTLSNRRFDCGPGSSTSREGRVPTSRRHTAATRRSEPRPCTRS